MHDRRVFALCSNGAQRFLMRRSNTAQCSPAVIILYSVVVKCFTVPECYPEMLKNTPVMRFGCSEHPSKMVGT